MNFKSGDNMELHTQAIEIGKSKEKGVSFANMPITDADIQEICKNHRLVNVDLEGTNITDKALAYLATLPNLGYLWLANTKITGEGFVHFANHKKLQVIDANQTNLMDETLKIIAKLPKLHTLHIDNTLVTFDGMLLVADNKKLNLIAKTIFSAEQLEIFKQTQRNLAKKKTSASISEDDILVAKNHLLAFFNAMTEWEKFANLNSSKGSRDEMILKIKELYQKYATEKYHNEERPSWSGMDGGTYGKHQITDIEIISKNRFYIYTKENITKDYAPQHRFLMIRQKDNSWRIDNRQRKYGNWEKQRL